MNVRELRHRLTELEQDWDHSCGDFQDQIVCINFYLGEETEELESISIDSYSGFVDSFTSKESESIAKKSRKYISLS